MGLFHAEMSTIKVRNSIDLTEAEDIKRWQEYTEELYKKKVLMTQITIMVYHSPRARRPGVSSQVSLRTHSNKQS